jgi:uncharacterized protein
LTSAYRRPAFLFTAHLETIYPALLRHIDGLPLQRERIKTPDDDFLDLDWLCQGSQNVVIISHGLEGSSTRAYVQGMARAVYAQGFDVICWNFRGCSGEMNHQLRFYHSGATEDLDCVVKHALQKRYIGIYLAGFSLGGNLTLKYLGERPHIPEVKRVVVFSVPLDLHASCQKISSPSNWIYSNRFLKSLKNKIVQKSTTMEGLDIRNIGKIKTLIQFDDQYTAPLHGFRNAIEYYTACSAIHFLKDIQTPTLLVNAQNDPFLSESCFPLDELKNHPFITFENPKYGGHVGFAQFGENGLYWSEERAVSFLISV